MAFMLDTSTINRILDDHVGNEWSLRGDIFVTDIQLQEILDTRDPDRRSFLFRVPRWGSVNPSPLGDGQVGRM